ncbi:hypothetical protein [Desulfosoma caldarium]|uniref:YopA central domain-containing protein n=1 Tax=Desulfosoma caldarium TaxID=610254 RepID=A0A3N1UUG4_9BACT|nr:hypothetical protein [Desulfosoma caldarium]ROQ92177.1 hypothetical protein EDC27_1866 [Desulfosoma caldarium]
MNTDKHRLEPAYDFSSGESSVLLYQGQAEMRIEGNNYAGDGEVRLALLPRANINIYGYFSGVSGVGAVGTIFNVKEISTFSINGRQIEGFRIDSGFKVAEQQYRVKWSPKFEPITGVGDDSTSITRVVFHLFNFVDLLGTRKSTQQSKTAMHTIYHVDLDCDDWNVELKSLLSTRENFKKLKQEGGYQLTHIGEIQKADQTPFTGRDADGCLHALRFFLSFAKGGWCEPICAVGFDAFGNRVWESWSSPRHPWQNFLSWFNPHQGSQLSTLFPGFMKRWANDDWREALREVIYWYLNANDSSRGIDAGIILTQAAIERLSYEYSVKEKKLLTSKGFKDLWASDKFRLLFSSLRIPLDIPPETPRLQSLASAGQMNWLDAPHALTEIRNSLVHPEHKRRCQLETVYYEAWNLGLWYLEMSILAICGYSGTYWNRLKQRWVGQTEVVPWKE